MIGRIIVVGAKRIAARFARKAAVLETETRLVTEKNAETLLNLVRQNASGRPGPNVVTGAYRASWHIEREGDSVVVTTYAPQAARLEFGFVGEDSLGRNYNQPPFPHAMPAADVIEGVYFNDMVLVVTRDL